MKKICKKSSRYKLFAFLIAVFGLIADQLSKLIVYQYLPNCQNPVSIIPGIIDFRYVENTGAAFGWFSDSRWVFLTATTVFLIAAVVVIIKMKTTSKLVYFSLFLIISGGIGNMIDRIFRGFVIDFINFSFVHFFVFNIADCCVVIGCGLLLIYLVLDTVKQSRAGNISANGDSNNDD